MHRLIALIICTLPVQAMAYELLGASWRLNAYPGGVPYCPVINAKDATTTTLRQQFGAAVDAGMLAWTAAGSPADGVPGAPCSAFVAAKVTCSGSPSEESSQPWIYWEANWSSISGVGPSTIGVTPLWSSGNEITEAKVIFNDRDYTWSVNGSGTDVGSIAVHELGHFVGLDHYDEYSAAKQAECSNASYPSVMCSYYSDGVSRVPTADDVLAICYLYPLAGALGSQCSAGSACNSGLCHAAGYCTQPCPCPMGYSCTNNQCVKDQPSPTCPVCGELPCGAGSICIGASGGSICTSSCIEHTDCPLPFYCADLEGGGGVCWPLGNACGAGPNVGEPCGNEYTCAYGNICLTMQGGGTECFRACRTAGDCPTGTSCWVQEPGLGYCDTGSPACTCNVTAACDLNCPCDPACSCACDTTAACDAGCACDPSCCACDATTACDFGCACDPECQCDCDKTTACDSSCRCDPECGDGCAAVAPLGRAGLAAVTLLGLVAALWRRRWRR